MECCASLTARRSPRRWRGLAQIRRGVQINPNDSKAEGGSCFGDSGGGVFWKQYVLGDASYVNSLACNATGTYQRDDTPYSRAFLNYWISRSR
jgi:hypothetical protein